MVEPAEAYLWAEVARRPAFIVSGALREKREVGGASEVA
jgi:hypothetical protein